MLCYRCGNIEKNTSGRNRAFGTKGERRFRSQQDEPRKKMRMDSEPGRSLILWTIRISVALYAAAVWRRLKSGPRTPHDKAFLFLWGASFVFCVIHVVCAFHYEHHWSNTEAYQHTAGVTAATTGIYWGGGLYMNYAFLLWWGYDVSVRYLSGRQRSDTAIQAMTAFMFFNATVVFGPEWWWIPTIIFTLFSLPLVMRRVKSGTTPVDEPSKPS